jgi:hypothetical protein
MLVTIQYYYLLCMHHWLYVLRCCQSNYVVNWYVDADGEEEG